LNGQGTCDLLPHHYFAALFLPVVMMTGIALSLLVFAVVSCCLAETVENAVKE